MRLLIAVTLIIYLVGVGVALAPTIQTNWSGATAAGLAGSLADALPGAVAWPARAYRSITSRG